MVWRISIKVKKDHLIQPENCKNFSELQESPDTTGELRESKKLYDFGRVVGILAILV